MNGSVLFVVKVGFEVVVWNCWGFVIWEFVSVIGVFGMKCVMVEVLLGYVCMLFKGYVLLLVIGNRLLFKFFFLENMIWIVFVLLIMVVWFLLLGFVGIWIGVGIFFFLEVFDEL